MWGHLMGYLQLTKKKKMLQFSLNGALSWTSIPSTKALKNSHNSLLMLRASNFIIRGCSNSTVEAISDRPTTNYSGIKLQETVDVNSGKLRLDSWISSRINGISRARVQSSIRSGLVSVNGRVVDKVSVYFSFFSVVWFILCPRYFFFLVQRWMTNRWENGKSFDLS